jgi:sporulation protein YlmC with PRC-barrel domain
MKHPIHTSSGTRCEAGLRITKPLAISAMSALLLATPIALQPQLVRSEVVHLVEVDVKVAEAGYRASKLIGKPVLNDTAEEIGRLDDIILGQDAKANFAIVEVGGFLGIGAHLVAVPFESLKIDKVGNKILLPGASKTALEKLAEFKYG